MQAELEQYQIKVGIPEPFLQKHLSAYFAQERHVKAEYLKARHNLTSGDDDGLSGSEYGQVVAQAALNLGWCEAQSQDAGELDPRAVAWASNAILGEVLSYAIVPKALSSAAP